MSGPVWLPRGFSFLSGLPTPARKRRLLVPIQLFIDDSGGEHPGFIVLGGLIGRAEEWAEFAELGGIAWPVLRQSSISNCTKPIIA